MLQQQRLMGTKTKTVSLTAGLNMAKLDIVTREFDITPTLLQRVEDKVGKALNKFRLNYVSSHVVLRLHKNPNTESHTHNAKKDSQIAEVTVNLKGGAVIHLAERSDDMYASIDVLSHKLNNKLRQYKEKIKSKHHDEEMFSSNEGVNEVVDLIDRKEEIEKIQVELLELPRKIEKQKSFSMPAMRADEAAELFEYLDHPFYVFRNKETGEVNVLYKRLTGGVGHIQPADDAPN